MSDKKTEKLFAKALKVTASSSNTGNYKSAVLRINNANTVADLQKLEKSFDHVYNAGHLTVSEFQRLDSKIMDKIARLEAGEGKTLGVSRKSLGVSQASLTGYSGNIRPYDLFEIQQRLEAFCRKNNTSLKALQTKYLSSGFSPTRFRFDLFNAAVVPAYDTAQGKSQVHNRLNAYADDKDVDKAMAFIIARSK